MEFVGNKAAYSQLNAIIPEARVVLLSGPAGVGKMLAAGIVARDIADDVDTYEYRGRLTTVIARGIVELSRVKPYMNGYKVFVLECEEYSDEAINILLKLLEEPPEYVIIMLVSSRELPETIVSRCKTIVFGGMSKEEVSSVLERTGLDQVKVESLSDNVSVGSALLESNDIPIISIVRMFLNAVDYRDKEYAFRLVNTKWSDKICGCMSAELKGRLVSSKQKGKIIKAIKILDSNANYKIRGALVAMLLFNEE